jgi:homoserine O-acetyltransferase/O-succinyltransferase
MPNIQSPRHIYSVGALDLHGGDRLSEVEVAYEQYGHLSPAGDNAVVICHALTGSARAAGEAGWWDPVIGPDAAFDTNRYAVFCANILGSCYGTTGPASINPATGEVYGPDFPRITVHDMVAVQRALLEAMDVRSIVTVAGGSLGGLQVLEWAAQSQDTVRSIIPIACSLAHSAWAIGFNETARQAIRADVNWHRGDYVRHGVRPDAGLALARMIAMISYRSEGSFAARFGRETRPRGDYGTGTYEVESYLHYQGEKFIERFDANCYIHITHAMDDFDVAHGREDAHAALAPFRGPAMVMGIDSDILYPTRQQGEIVDLLRDNGNRVDYREIHSPHGHDSFLIEWDQLDRYVREFLSTIE